MKNSLYKSLALHVAVFIILIIDLPFLSGQRDDVMQVPIIVDLKDIKISEMTNLPPKAKFGKEDKEANQVKRKIEEAYTPPETKPEAAKPEPKQEKTEKVPESVPVPEDKPTLPKQDYLEAPKPSAKPKAPTPVPSKKPTPPKSEPKKADAKKTAEDKSKPELANPLKSLLASVDAMEKNIGSANQSATIKEGTAVSNMGVEGGVGGSYFSELSISELDAIAGRLRACWNLDPGAMGIEDMVVEIRAFLNQDGTVKDVKILNTSRYNSDNHFRSVADSAKRAVYICAPYAIFAERYQDKYDKWKVLYLRFNPLDGNIN